MRNSQNAINLFGGMITGLLTSYALDMKQSNAIKLVEQNSSDYQVFYTILLQWIRLQQEGHSLTEYFNKKNYKTVAIYDMNELGVALLNELQDTGIEVKYIIENDMQSGNAGYKVVTEYDDFIPVDVIVVTTVHDYVDVVTRLRKKGNFVIVSIDDVIYETLN